MRRLHRFDVLTQWYCEYMTINNYRPRNAGDYRYEISSFRRWLEETTDIDDINDITPQVLHDFAASLYDRKLGARTIHHKLSALSSFFAACYTENKLYSDLSRHIQLPRITRNLPTGILTETEVQRIFDYLDSATASLQVKTLTDAVLLRDRAVFDVLYSTGMRKSELARLTHGDIDYENGLVCIREGKGGKDRVVPIAEKSLAAVERYIGEARPMLYTGTSDTLFITRHGRALGVQTLRQTIINVTKAAGIERHIKVHTIRHTCATHMLNHGADIRYVQVLLGHASLTSTQVYTHVSISKLKETHRKHHPREQQE